MIRIHWVAIRKPEDVAPSAQKNQLLFERAVILFLLDPDTIYTPSQAAATAYRPFSPEYEATRRSFGALSRRHGIQFNYDNINKGETDDCGWSGSSWQSILHPVYACEVGKLMDQLQELNQRQPGPYLLVNGLLVHEATWQEAQSRKRRRPRKATLKKAASPTSQPTEVSMRLPTAVNQLTPMKTYPVHWQRVGYLPRHMTPKVMAPYRNRNESNPEPDHDGKPKRLKALPSSEAPRQLFSWKKLCLVLTIVSMVLGAGWFFLDEEEPEPARVPHQWMASEE